MADTLADGFAFCEDLARVALVLSRLFNAEDSMSIGSLSLTGARHPGPIDARSLSWAAPVCRAAKRALLVSGHAAWHAIGCASEIAVSHSASSIGRLWDVACRNSSVAAVDARAVRRKMAKLFVSFSVAHHERGVCRSTKKGFAERVSDVRRFPEMWFDANRVYEILFGANQRALPACKTEDPSLAHVTRYHCRRTSRCCAPISPPPSDETGKLSSSRRHGAK